MKLDEIDIDQDNIILENLARNFVFKMKSNGGDIGKAAQPIIKKYEMELFKLLSRLQADVMKLTEMKTSDEQGKLHSRMDSKLVAIILIQDILDKIEKTGV